MGWVANNPRMYESTIPHLVDTASKWGKTEGTVYVMPCTHDRNFRWKQSDRLFSLEVSTVCMPHRIISIGNSDEFRWSLDREHVLFYSDGIPSEFRCEFGRTKVRSCVLWALEVSEVKDPLTIYCADEECFRLCVLHMDGWLSCKSLWQHVSTDLMW